MKKPPFTPILIIIGSLALLGTIGWGTFAILRQLKPAALNSLTGKNQTSQPAPQATGPDADRERAEQLVKANKLTDAKAAYQTALAGYIANSNTSAAADVKMQLAILEVQLKNQTVTTQQPHVIHQTGSVK